MNSDLKELMGRIELYLEGKVSVSDLEQETLTIVTDNRFDQPPDEIQAAVYALDNKEIDDLTRDEVSEARTTIERYIKESG
jgi:hypothetical protein